MDESAMKSNWPDVTFVAREQHLIKILKIDEQYSILSKWIPPLTAEGPFNILICSYEFLHFKIILAFD